MVVSFWCLGPFILVSLRCFLLLKALSYRTTWIQAFKLQLTGFFFNTSILGAVCGELIKVMYVIRDNKKLGKTSALISFLVDHIIGIQSIFVVGVITAFLNIKFILNNPKLVVINGLILALVVTILILFIVSLYHYKDDRDPWERLLNQKIPGVSVVRKIYQNIRAYRHHRKAILQCFTISLIIQSAL